MNLPTMPLIIATGRKMMTRLSVVAKHREADVARPINEPLPSGVSFFSSMKRKIFSSTTMASSITMPTISTSASIVIWSSVKPMAFISV